MDLAANGGITHSFFRGPVLFPFGFGLSYTSFQSNMHWIHKEGPLSSNEQSLTLFRIPASALIERAIGNKVLASVQITLENTGSIVSDHVCMLFISKLNASATEPVQALADFKRFLFSVFYRCMSSVFYMTAVILVPKESRSAVIVCFYRRMNAVVPKESRSISLDVSFNAITAFFEAPASGDIYEVWLGEREAPAASVRIQLE